MKTFFKTFLPAVVFAGVASFCSCSKLPAEIPSETTDETVSLKEMTFQIVGGSKTILDGSNVLWADNERISVFDGYGNRFFSSQSGSGSTSVFVGYAAESSEYTLLYPYNPEAVLSAEGMRTTIPTDQPAVLNSFGPDSNVSIGIFRDSDGGAVMNNVCALAKVTISPGVYNVTSVKLSSASGEKLSGLTTIAFDGTDSPAAAMDVSAENYVSIVSDKPLSGGAYYFVVAPGSVSGLTIRFNMAGGQYSESVISGPLQFVTNGILNLGNLSVPAPIGYEEESNDPVSDPVSTHASKGINFSSLPMMGHPRLFLNASQMEALRNRVVCNPDENDFYYKLHVKIMNNAVYYLNNSTSPTYTLVNGKLLEQSRVGLMRLFHFAYAYRMTGDVSYLTAAKADIATVCAFSDWNASGHFLDNSEMALGVAVAYDWLYPELTLSEKQSIHQALVNFELTPFLSYHPVTNSNWNQVSNGGAIAASIVLYEKEKTKCANAIDKAITSNLTAVDYMYNPNGNGIEGYGYWEYAATYEAVIVNALESAFNSSCGITEVNGFMNTPSWKLFMDGVTGPFNFSDDCSENHSVTPVMIWFGARYSKPEYLVVEKHLMENADRIGHRCMPLMMCGMQKYGYVDSDAAFPSEKMWVSGDDLSPIALVRTGWSFGWDDRYFGFKGSGGYNNHAHMDAGSFVYDALGKRWASDIPMGAYSDYSDNSQLFNMYQSSNRWDILCQNSYFHNTLSFTKGVEKAKAGKLHPTDQIVGGIGSLVAVYNNDTDGYGAKMNLSTYYSDFVESVYRTVKIKDGDLYVIDEITSKSSFSAPFEWRMVTKTDIEIGTDFITLSKSSAKMYLKTTVTSGSASGFAYGSENVERPSAWTVRSWDSAQNYSKFKVVKYSAKVPANTTTVFTTILSPNSPE